MHIDGNYLVINGFELHYFWFAVPSALILLFNVLQTVKNWFLSRTKRDRIKTQFYTIVPKGTNSGVVLDIPAMSNTPPSKTEIRNLKHEWGAYKSYSHCIAQHPTTKQMYVNDLCDVTKAGDSLHYFKIWRQEDGSIAASTDSKDKAFEGIRRTNMFCNIPIKKLRVGKSVYEVTEGA